MVATATSGIAAKSTEDDEVVLQNDLWSKSVCILCQDVCASKEAKVAHSKTSRHIRKMNIYTCFSKEVVHVKSCTQPSRLKERYEQMHVKAVGLECIHEFVFPFASTGWWACSICYDAGCSFDQVDDHLASVDHLRQYIEEFHPCKSLKREDASLTERLDHLMAARDEIFDAEQGGDVLAPEVIEMQLNLEMAKTKLVVGDSLPPYTVHSAGEDGKKFIIQCNICHELIPSTKKLTERAWRIHCRNSRHRRFHAIRTITKQFSFERLEEEREQPMEIKWKNVDNKVYGPLRGTKWHCRMGEKSLCELCGCMVDSMEEHFSSERHLLRFLCALSPVDGWQVSQMELAARRLTLLSRLQTGSERANGRKECKDAMPAVLVQLASEEEEETMIGMPTVEALGMDSTCLFCPICWMALKVEKRDSEAVVWNEHVVGEDHLDYASRRSALVYDDDKVVPVTSSIALLPAEAQGTWKVTVVDGINYKMQTQCDVGLEYVVEDVQNNEAVCTLCARSFPLGKECRISTHIRSYLHLNQYMHVMNKTMLSLLLLQKSEKAVEELIMEWLQRDVVSAALDLRVYDEKKAEAMKSWPKIPIRAIELSTLHSDIRPIYESLLFVVDTLATDGAEKQCVDARTALLMSHAKILSMDTKEDAANPRILLRCNECELCFVGRAQSLASDCWDGHFSCAEHKRRLAALSLNRFTASNFAAESSTYTVRPFLQKDPQKKVTWQWNAKEKRHDLVLVVVGLEEMVEKRSADSVIGQSNHSDQEFAAHFFCRLCAVVVGKRAHLLEEHVRSSEHVLAYVHKNYPWSILDLEKAGLSDGGRERRKLLAQLLKDVKPPADYCIPVYDPVGETERKQNLATQKARQEEIQKRNDAARLRAIEERKKADEIKRKFKEEEAVKERERIEERDRRNRMILEKAAALEDEKQRVRKIALEKQLQQDMEKRKALEEKQRAAKEIAMTALDPRLKELMERKNELQSKLDKLRQTTAVPEPKLVIPNPSNALSTPRGNGHDSLSAFMGSACMSVMSAPPPMMTGIAPLIGPGSYNIPPPTFTAFNPPPSFGGPVGYDLVGPKPVLPSFIPKVDAMPVFPAKSEERGSRSRSSSRSPSPPPRLPEGTRPSLANAQVDPYIANPQIIINRQMLVDYMWRQGTELIPEMERPARFSRMACATQGVVGVEYVYEVVCLDDPSLTTFFCSMCSNWTTPNDMLSHLVTSQHRMAFLFRNYKLYHRTVETEVDPKTREVLIDQYAIQIQKRDQPPPTVNSRLKCVLNTVIVDRLWPACRNFIDHSWKQNPVCRTPSPPPRNRKRRHSRSRSRSWQSRSESSSYSRSRSRSRSRERRGRSRSHSPSRDRHRNIRSRSPSRSRRRCSRSRSQSRERRRRTPSPPSRVHCKPPPSAATATGIPSLMAQTLSAIPPSANSAPLSSFPPSTMKMPHPNVVMGIPPSALVNLSLPPPGILPSSVPPPSAAPPLAVPPPAKVETPEWKKKLEQLNDGEKEREKKSYDRRTSDGSTKKNESKGNNGQKKEVEKKETKEVKKDVMKEKERRELKEKERLREKEKKQREKEMKEREERRKKEKKEEHRQRKYPGWKKRRSRSRSPRRSRSRSRGRDRAMAEEASSSMDWDAKAAAFLAKIGDLQGASSMLASSAKTSTNSGSPSTAPLRAAHNSPAPVSSPPRGLPIATVERIDSPAPQYSPLYDEQPASASAAAPAADIRMPMTATAAAVQQETPEALQRKLLGVLVTMQQESERRGQLTDELVKRIYSDVGLSHKSAGAQDELLSQLVQMLGGAEKSGQRKSLNLQEYGIGGPPPQQRAPPQEQQYRPPPTAEPRRGYGARPTPTDTGAANISDMLMSIKDSLAAIQTQRVGRGPAPSSSRYTDPLQEMYPEREASYVYTGPEDDQRAQLTSRRPPGPGYYEEGYGPPTGSRALPRTAAEYDDYDMRRAPHPTASDPRIYSGGRGAPPQGRVAPSSQLAPDTRMRAPASYMDPPSQADPLRGPAPPAMPAPQPETITLDDDNDWDSLETDMGQMFDGGKQNAVPAVKKAEQPALAAATAPAVQQKKQIKPHPQPHLQTEANAAETQTQTQRQPRVPANHGVPHNWPQPQPQQPRPAAVPAAMQQSPVVAAPLQPVYSQQQGSYAAYGQDLAAQQQQPAVYAQTQQQPQYYDYYGQQQQQQPAQQGYLGQQQPPQQGYTAQQQPGQAYSTQQNIYWGQQGGYYQ